jgi:hypothetical protein
MVITFATLQRIIAAATVEVVMVGLIIRYVVAVTPEEFVLEVS